MLLFDAYSTITTSPTFGVNSTSGSTLSILSASVPFELKLLTPLTGCP